MDGPDTGSILEHVTSLARSLLPADEASLILWDAERETFTVSASTIAEQPPEYAGRRARRTGGASRWIIDHQEPLVVGDADRDPFTAADMLREASLSAYVGVPIVFEGESLGVLYALDRRPREYAPSDVDFMRILAKRAAYSIGIAHLIEQMHELASTDELTGVANRREFFRRGTLEIERDDRTHRGLAMIMFDIDRFKAINDACGHAAGDEVLAEIARRCESVIRGVDLLARTGGEEFAVLLPEADTEVARSVAERLRVAVADEPFPVRGDDRRITLTLGVAVRTDADADVATLLGRADRALYEGKQAGRDRVVVAR